MPKLAGLPTPNMDWSSSDTPQALKKFKNVCELYFSAPLKDKSEEEQVSYLLIWSGEEGIQLVSTWSLSADKRKKKLCTYWEKFAECLAPRSNFRLARYKLCTLKQEPGEAVDSFLKKVRILVTECKYTNPDEHIIDALIFGSNNPHVQSKLLEHDSTLTFDRAMSIARRQKATGRPQQLLMPWNNMAAIHDTGTATPTIHPPAQGFQDGKCRNCGTFHNPSMWKLWQAWPLEVCLSFLPKSKSRPYASQGHPTQAATGHTRPRRHWTWHQILNSTERHFAHARHSAAVLSLPVHRPCLRNRYSSPSKDRSGCGSRHNALAMQDWHRGWRKCHPCTHI